jgi:DeoR family fructose operon transcriptional repressor
LLTQERYQLILQLLGERKTITVAELTQALGASEATVRRDLNTLAGMGRLNKVHGGATALGGSILVTEADVSTKSTLHVSEKQVIGQYAASLIEHDDFVYIDAGTTTGKLIDCLGDVRATFVTNGIDHARRLAQRGLKTYLLGGQFKLSTEAIVGAAAVQGLRQYNFTKCFMGTNGVDASAGFTTPDTEEAILKAEAVGRSYLAFVLADESKFGLVSPVTFAPLTGCCILTNHLPDESYRAHTVIKVVTQEAG